MQSVKQGAKQKIVNRYAHDAFILINEQNFILNGATGEKVFFNDDVSTFNISGSVDAPPAKASFNIFVPRHEQHRYFVNGKPILFPMMEIKFFIKGRFRIFYENGDISPPKPYQQFHGVITSVSDEYSGDMHTISVECEDLLYFMKITKMAIHPSILHSQSTGSAVTVRKSNYETMNAKDIVRDVVNFAFGGEAGTDDQRRKNSVYVPETFNETAFIQMLQNTEFDKIDRQDFIDTQQRVLSDYWIKRLKIIENGKINEKDSNYLQLFIFGYTLPTIKKSESDPNDSENQTDQAPAITKEDTDLPLTTESRGNRAEGQSVRDPFGIISSRERAAAGNLGYNEQAAKMDELIEKAQPFAQLAQVNVINSEYESLFDIALVCRDYIGYEFYMSLEGSIVFKPPFLNIDVKPYRPFVIKDEDVVSFSLRETDDVITIFTVKGALSQTVLQGNTQLPPNGVAWDYKLAQQFLNRVQTTDLQMGADFKGGQLSQADFLAIYAQNRMDIHNSRRFQGSITIPGTPEIKLGYPVYIESRDCYGYVTGINHAFAFGSSYQTTLTVEGIRYKSASGNDKVLKPSGINALVLNTSHRDEEFNKREQDPTEIAGTGMDSSKVREEFPATSADKAGDWFKTRSQRVSDIDGYELIGTIGFGADLMINSYGKLVAKVAPLDFDTTLYTEEITRAISMNNVDIGTSKETNSISQPTPQTEVQKSTGSLMDSVDLDNSKLPTNAQKNTNSVV